MSDIVTSRIFVDGEKGITAAKLNDITASSVIQPAFYTSKPTAGTADPTDIVLILKSGAYAQVPISTLGGSATQAQIWSTRLRSFNSVGNCTFEVDQRNAGSPTANPASGTFLLDRWGLAKVGTMVFKCQQSSAASGIVLPGTSFNISGNYLICTLTTQEVSLAAGDLWMFNQSIEGSLLRELLSDVSSISLLVASTVAPLKFSVAIRDTGPTTKSLVKLCTIPTANTWTLIQLPNLPVFPSGNLSISPGVAGYLLGISLASGTTFTAPAADTWQNGNFVAAPGMDNFASKPVNSIFQVAFIQHEPGAVCSTLMDKPFTQNYDECLRYFCKSYSYGFATGAVTGAGRIPFLVPTGFTTSPVGPENFPKPMAKAPTVTAYSDATGAINTCRDQNASADKTVSGISAHERKIYQLTLSAAATAGGFVTFHYTADTGW